MKLSLLTTNVDVSTNYKHSEQSKNKLYSAPLGSLCYGTAKQCVWVRVWVMAHSKNWLLTTQKIILKVEQLKHYAM